MRAALMSSSESLSSADSPEPKYSVARRTLNIHSLFTVRGKKKNINKKEKFTIKIVEKWMNPWWEKQQHELASSAQEPSYLHFHRGSPGNGSWRCPGR